MKRSCFDKKIIVDNLEYYKQISCISFGISYNYFIDEEHGFSVIRQNLCWGFAGVERIRIMRKRKCILLIYMIVLLGLLVSCKKVIFDGKDKPLPTTPATKAPTAAASDGQVGQTPEDNSKPEKQPTDVPVQEATGTPLPTPTEAPVENTPPANNPSATSSPSPIPTASPVPEPLTAAEAGQLLLGAIGGAYRIEQSGAVETADSAYYLFTVSDDEHVYSPQIAVDARSRDIYYYYSQDEIAEFVNFPPDNLESAGQEEDEVTADDFSERDAVALLNKLSAADLGLPAALGEYTILVDEWTTMVYGLECYCVNAYAELENRKQLMGVYFVAIDGSAAYRSDMGDFILIY